MISSPAVRVGNDPPAPPHVAPRRRTAPSFVATQGAPKGEFTARARRPKFPGRKSARYGLETPPSSHARALNDGIGTTRGPETQMHRRWLPGHFQGSRKNTVGHRTSRNVPPVCGKASACFLSKEIALTAHANSRSKRAQFFIESSAGARPTYEAQVSFFRLRIQARGPAR